MQKVLILGATSPIARALALKFAYDGAQLYLAARDAGEAQRVAEDVCFRAGVGTLSGTFDAVDFASHDEFIRHAANELGGLDGVVVCFGTVGDEDAAQTDPDAAIATIHQNFTGAVSLITLAARHLEQQRSGFDDQRRHPGDLRLIAVAQIGSDVCAPDVAGEEIGRRDRHDRGGYERADGDEPGGASGWDGKCRLVVEANGFFLTHPILDARDLG